MRRSTLVALSACVVVPVAQAQWVTTHEQFYLEAPHNWQFRERYAAADRLFNAFDFGHAILYERLWRNPRGAIAELERHWYDRLTTDILVRPPRLPLEEGAIEIAYVKLAPEAKAMFEWAHILHRQVYDVLADERMSSAQKDAEIARLMAYYRTRPDLAFSARPKSMALMEGQPYSLAFRRAFPKFNGLIWAYHWLQVGLYEPLLVHDTPVARQAGVRATVARFWQMLGAPPATMPHVMPMTAAVAPTFTARYPEAAIVFDNLHSMHDVISDILANPSVPKNRKRAEILLAAARFRDDTSFITTVAEWRAMAQHMGLENMGGPSVEFLPALPTPSVVYGAVMAPPGGEAGAADPHAAHRAAAATPSAPATPDSAAVVAVVERYHAALAAGDSAAALALLTPDAVVLESGGLETRDEYRAHHLPADIEFARAVPSTRVLRAVRVQGDMAQVSSTSTTQGEFRGRAVNSTGAELMVLTRTADGWRITAIHWSSRARRD